MEDTRQFPCPGCGGDMVFDTDNQMLACQFCGNKVEIKNKEHSDINEYPIEDAEEKASRDWGGQTVTIHCDSCGAETIIQANQLSTDCSFCGSKHIRKDEKDTAIKPESLIPFKINKNNAVDKFREWLKKRWLAPRDLKILAKSQKIIGVYIPFWTYDAETNSFYTAQKGTYYYVTETVRERGPNGEMRTVHKQVRKTRWSYTSGSFYKSFDDVLVNASNREGKKLVKKLEPYHMGELVPYKQEYLAGFMAEKYSIGLKDGYEEAKSFIRSTLRSDITRHINADEVRNLNINTSYSNVTFKHLLLPVWLSAYRYKDKVYKFMINGQTGEVQGESPLSPIKIALLVILGLALAAAFFLLFRNR